MYVVVYHSETTCMSSLMFWASRCSFDQSLFLNYFEYDRALGGIVDSGTPESVVLLVRHDSGSSWW